MRMMDEIAPRVRAKYPHAFFYTEANGPYAAKGHEYRYNYDTHWLFPALTPIVDPRGGPRGNAKPALAGNALLARRRPAGWKNCAPLPLRE